MVLCKFILAFQLTDRTAVGGIREKVLGAHRAGITRVILPAQNEKDAHDLPPSVSSMRLNYVRTVEGLLEEVWGHDVWGGGRVQARL